MEKVKESIYRLEKYIKTHGYKGYDPYDILNSPLRVLHLNRYISSVAIQISKRIPFNFRPFLTIKKDYNSKALGLLLKAYCQLYRLHPEVEFKKSADEILQILLNLQSKNYSGACWGYNFDWSTPGSYLPAYTPSVVVTSFVVDGLNEYREVFKNEEVKELILSSTEYVIKDLKLRDNGKGLYIPYTHISTGLCYNASLLGAEILIKAFRINGNEEFKDIALKVAQTVLEKQKEDGHWKYSLNLNSGVERDQVDFHQGFVLVSLHNILKYSGISKHSEYESALKKGLRYYIERQFDKNGRAFYRLPKKFPADIHHQAQGIITCAALREYDDRALKYANLIAEWTINNMQAREGYFYYRKYRWLTNKIAFMRWGQAWMLLALTTLENENRK